MANTLLLGQRLNPGDALISPSNQFQLLYQKDGNLVLYDTTKDNPGWPWLWQSKTSGTTPGFVLLQNDGNLAIYNNAQQVIWSTGTWLPTKKGMSLVLQDDGNLVLYGIASLFSSFTDAGAAGSPVSPPAPGHENGNGVSLQSVVQTAEDVAKAAEGVVSVLQAVFSLL